MFSGTPCQIRALKSYLDKNYDNLILIDLFCHGVPSPKIWQRYLEFINPEKNVYNLFHSEINESVGKTIH